MAETKTYTYSDVSEHTTKKDVWMVIHDKVYDASSFVDEHPGGEEVLLDVGGQDATEAFEDVGHSDEAREILQGLLKGDLERKVRLASKPLLSTLSETPADHGFAMLQDGDPAPKISTSTSTPSKVGGSDAAGLGIGVYALILAGGALAFFAYQYLQSSSQKQS
ncbi:cytochrome b5 [Teratosphaeria destructans]|uniref:Cytochrome b5 n=1 Tax=Teratosphaeria destructans TaxID=418781 RepID=A0A9W7SQR9_9PEZI|nr:cytochrome b5 [Teratosphaeria destructans]